MRSARWRNAKPACSNISLSIVACSGSDVLDIMIAGPIAPLSGDKVEDQHEIDREYRA
jgi:hypothetical protein